MVRLLLLFFVWIACHGAGALAQVTAVSTVSSELFAAAGRNRQSVPAGTVLGAPVVLRPPAQPCTFGAGFLNASLQVTPRVDGVHAVLYASNLGPCVGQAAAGGTIRVRWTAPTPVLGHLRIDAPLNIGAAYSVTPGFVEWSGGSFDGAFHEAPLTVEPTGTEVEFRFLIDTARFNRSPNRASIMLRFVPGPSRISVEGSACGPDLDVWYTDRWTANLNRRGITMRAHGMDPTWPAQFFVIGIHRQRIAIPPTMCPLLTDVVVPWPIRLVGGEALREFSVASVTQPVTFRVQYLSGALVGGVEQWRTSEVFQVRLP